MKYNPIGLIVLLCLNMTVAAQQRINVDSKIKHVNVFFDQALVERSSILSLAPGAYQLVFSKLSPLLLENSLELKVPSGMVIQSVSTKTRGAEADEAKPLEIQLLEDSVERINNELFLVQADLESLQLQRELLLSNKQIGGVNGLKADELEDVLGIYSAKLAEFKSSKLRLVQAEKTLLKQLDILMQLLNQYKHGKLSLNQEVLAMVLVERPMNAAVIELKYRVSGVSWLPIYDVRVNKLGGPITFVLKASVSQASGEDWQDVKLKVSDINVQSQSLMPTLEPYFLRFEQPILYKAFGAGNRMPEPSPMEATDSISAAMIAEMTYFTPPTIYRNPTGLSFETAVPYYIPSDGKSHWVELTRFDLPAVYKLMSVPKLDENVYVNAAVQCNDILNQISAEANIYFEGSFTGTGYVNRQENDTMLFTLGEEKRIVVQRSKISEQSSKSVFGGTKKEKSLWQIQVVNSGNDVVEIEVVDQIPVSTDKEIEVKVLQTEGALFEAESGRLTWKLKLLPKQSQKLRFEYEISYPKGKLINNG